MDHNMNSALPPEPPVFTPPPIPPYQPNTKGLCFGRALLPVGVYVGAQFAVGLPMFFVHMIRYMLATGDYYLAHYSFGAVIAPMAFFSALAGTIALWFFYRRETKERWVLPKGYPPGFPKTKMEPFALTQNPKKGLAALFFVAGVTTLASNLLVTVTISILRSTFPLPPSPVAEMMESIPQTPFHMWLIFLSVAVLAPLGEELCFRGLCQNHLRRAFPFWAANLMQAGLFGAIHMNWEQGSYAFLLGLAYGWLYEKTGRLSLVIYLHLVFNVAGYFIMAIPRAEDILSHSPAAFYVLLLPAATITAAGIICSVSLLRGHAAAAKEG